MYRCGPALRTAVMVILKLDRLSAVHLTESPLTPLWQGAAPLHVAACNGYTSVIRFLVNQPKVDLNIKDNEGNTPLHLAVYFNGGGALA